MKKGQTKKATMEKTNTRFSELAGELRDTIATLENHYHQLDKSKKKKLVAGIVSFVGILTAIGFLRNHKEKESE